MLSGNDYSELLRKFNAYLVTLFLSNYQRSVLALRLEDLFREKAKENQKGGQGGILLKQKSAEAMPIETRQELAKVANVSHDTIAKKIPPAIKQTGSNKRKSILRFGNNIKF